MLKMWNCQLLESKDIYKFLTMEEIASTASSEDTVPFVTRPKFPVRVTIDGNGKLINIERVEREINSKTVGQNAVFTKHGKAERITYDALLCLVSVGDFIPGQGRSTTRGAYIFQIPFFGEEMLEGSVQEHFRLRHPFLGLTPDTPPFRQYKSMRYAVAEIEIATQKVVKLKLCPVRWEPQCGSVIDESKPGYISVACYLANGGCNFQCVIR